MGQPHEVRLASGRRIDWNAPPRPNARCLWTKRTYQGHRIKASFRTLCHMNRLNNLAIRKYDTQLVILQPPFNTSVPASKGTHDFDAVWDFHIPGVGWWEQQKFGRAHGLGCWYRHPPLFGNHVHGFTLPPRSGSPTHDFKVAGFKVGRFIDGGLSALGHAAGSSQLVDYYNHALGLAGAHEPGSDRSWFPRSIEATIFDLGAYIARRAS